MAFLPGRFYINGEEVIILTPGFRPLHKAIKKIEEVDENYSDVLALIVMINEKFLECDNKGKIRKINCLGGPTKWKLVTEVDIKKLWEEFKIWVHLYRN